MSHRHIQLEMPGKSQEISLISTYKRLFFNLFSIVFNGNAVLVLSF